MYKTACVAPFTTAMCNFKILTIKAHFAFLLFISVSYPYSLHK